MPQEKAPALHRHREHALRSQRVFRLPRLSLEAEIAVQRQLDERRMRSVVGELADHDRPPLGLPDDVAFHRMLGAILAVSLALYLYPRTAILGAILR